MKRVIFTKTIREIALPSAIFIAEAIAAVVIDRTTPYLRHVAVPDITLTLIGTAISIVLAFRVNTAYARWWEARSLWGNLVNGSRSISRQALAVGIDSPHSAAFARRIIELQIAYIRIFAAQLTGREQAAQLRSTFGTLIAPVNADQENIAIGVLTDIAVEIRRAVDAQLFDTITAARMDATLTELTNAQGGCERIKLTPLPIQLSVLSSIFVYVYAGLLPLALADSLGLTMPFVSGIITFVFLSVAEIGTNLESPFAGSFYDISVLTIANGVENVLRSEANAVLGNSGNAPERKVDALLESTGAIA